jgi:hypothetical protein
MLKEQYQKYHVTSGNRNSQVIFASRRGGMHLSLKVLLSSNDLSQYKELHVREHYKQKRID